ncbi:MAG TPA: hypothetical protein VFF13_01865 [archaeon]|nr:hypothetical protein [archaeon]
MKGEQAEYTIALRNAFMFPPKKRIRKALNVIIRFAEKHARAKEIKISTEVNEYLHENSKNLPRKVNAILLKEENKITVFLQEGTQLKTYKENKEKTKKETEKKKKEEKGKEKKEDTGEDKEQKEKLEDKKEKEKAGHASSIKRKTNK